MTCLKFLFLLHTNHWIPIPYWQAGRAFLQVRSSQALRISREKYITLHSSHFKCPQGPSFLTVNKFIPISNKQVFQVHQSAVPNLSNSRGGGGEGGELSVMCSSNTTQLLCITAHQSLPAVSTEVSLIIYMEKRESWSTQHRSGSSAVTLQSHSKTRKRSQISWSLVKCSDHLSTLSVTHK